MLLLQAGRRVAHVGLSPRALVVLALLCVAVTACEVVDEAPLLELSPVESGEVVLGDALHVSGRGFPTGAECLVRLRGQLAQPAQLMRPIDVVLSARALSDEDIAVPLLSDKLPEIGLHATFAGEVSVSFAAAASASHVSGKLAGVTFDVVRANPDVTTRDSTVRHAQQTLQQLGIVLEDEPNDERGLRVAWAVQGGAAEQLQVKQGDVLTHRDGLRLRSIADLAPAAGATRVRLRMRPSDGSPARELEVSLARGSEPKLTQIGAIASATAVLMLVCVVWLAPMPRRLVRFQAPTSSAEGTRAIGAASLQRGRSWLAVVAWPALSALLWMGFAISHRWSIAAHLIGLSTLLGSAHLVLQASRLHGVDRVRGLLSELGRLTLIFAPLASASLIAGSVTLAGVVEQQGALPWQWFAFKVPPLLLSCVVFVSGCRRLMVDADEIHPLWASVLAAVLSGIGAAVFFGGWQPLGHSALGVVDRDVLGIVSFAGKAWVLMLAMTWRSAREDARLSWLIRGALAFASVALSIAWIRVDVAPSVEIALGYTLCGTTLMVLFLRMWRGPRRVGLSL